MERWTGTPEGTRNESCGCFGKRTPFLRGRVQLLGCEPMLLRTQLLGYETELNFTGRTPEHKKPAHQPSASVLFFFSFLSNR